MAKTEKKTTKAASTKKVAATTNKTLKKESTASVTKKIAVKPEAKKIAMKKEPEKITTAKALEKITAKPEPKKIETKVVSEPKATKKAVVKEEKTTTKQSAATKKAVSKVIKEVAPKKNETKKPASKVVKTPVKTEKKTEKKVTEKKASKALTNNHAEKMMQYSLEDCIMKMQAMGVMHSYEDYKDFLLDEANLKKIEKNIISGNALQEKDFDFEKDGYDLGLVGVTLQKVEDSLDIKAKDYPAIKKDMDACVKTSYGQDDEKNAKEYLKEFKVAEKILMIGQRKNITTAKELSTLLGSDVEGFVKHFFELAYTILPNWQYNDVKFYEDFAYAILSQFSDLYNSYQLEILIDCADLYIKHGDFKRGDENYGYILRDNQIKDYIYYRFVAIYKDIDLNKAKGLAYESLQYVDERYTYYPNIMEVLNK